MGYFPIIKVLIAASVIAATSWLSNKKPEIAGFLVALPLVSILAILFSYLEFKNTESTVTFAKSILIGVPISYLFFLPFFFAERLNLGFWGAFLSGLVLLVIGFFVHQAVMSWFR
ncbi:MAG: hypothetical protein WA790_18765 [Sulfitobacter sp.]|jgi:hypothetical protein|tara:strand:- start:411 stop:755 length:345 start_codon:yes stop_codon:yes gene_type:complete